MPTVYYVASRKHFRAVSNSHQQSAAPKLYRMVQLAGRAAIPGHLRRQEAARLRHDLQHLRVSAEFERFDERRMDESHFGRKLQSRSVYMAMRGRFRNS